SGGVLSHAPRRAQAARMLVDAFMPTGITQLAVDSIFMMPQLGVLVNIDKKDLKENARKAAVEVFKKDCLIRLGTCIAPVGKSKLGKTILTLELKLPDGNAIKHELKSGELIRIDAEYEPMKAILTPARNMDIGAGKGETINTKIYGGQVGILFDGRGRPLELPENDNERIAKLQEWSKVVNEYPDFKD
ncbi:MAG: methylaspartate mutase, partial [Candidatus Neomarinimicrobiota bacterium]